MPQWRSSFLAVLVVCALAACNGEGPRSTGAPGQGNGHQGPSLPTVTFETTDGRAVTMVVEVADTDELRTCGLMHRLSMPENQGMLFVFAQDSTGPFWNRNTFIPLTLAWIDAEGIIRNLTDMEPVHPEDRPQRNTLYAPGVTYRYVVEANQGWFARNGVSIGDRARLEEALAHGSQGAVPICREKGTEPVGGG